MLLYDGMNRKQIHNLEKIENYVNEYDSVFVLGAGIPESGEFFEAVSRQTAKKILLLVKGPEADGIPECGAEIQTISEEEYCDIEELYYMYEFSDRIHLLTDTAQYGSLGNYMATGLLTENETFAALLSG